MSEPDRDETQDADLRLSERALLRAAQRARELAMQTGTELVVSRNGVIERIRPDQEIDALWVEEAKRRLAAYRAGKVHGIPAEDVVGDL